ncbi:MAG: YidC/Oxa1 family membrane protein insertase [Patescibacteria group bacterium]
MGIEQIFTIIVYQPFFNVLLFIYYLLDKVTHGQPDMGVAVILLTLFIRFLMLPLSLRGHNSEEQKREIARQIKEIEAEYAAEPIVLRDRKRVVLKESRGVLIAEVFSLLIQTAIALMLWRIFASGLSGDDFHLVYSFMPEIKTPLNLVFLGKYDLTHPHLFLNLLQTLLIFVLETVSIYTSAYPQTRADAVRLQLILPIVSFLIFMNLPAGKKLFVITTLCFSIVLTICKAIMRRFEEYRIKREQAELMPAEEKVLIEIKE